MHKKLKYNITLCTFQSKTVYEKGKTGKKQQNEDAILLQRLPRI